MPFSLRARVGRCSASSRESEFKGGVIEDGLTIGGKPLKDVYEAARQSVAIGDEGVKSKDGEGVNEGVKILLGVIRSNPGKRANELAALIGKSVQSVERYVKALKDAGKIEFRGAPKNGGYYAMRETEVVA